MEEAKKLEFTWSKTYSSSAAQAKLQQDKEMVGILAGYQAAMEETAGDAYECNLRGVYDAFNVPEADRLPNAENYVCWPADVDTTSTGVSDVVTCMFNFNFELIDKGNKHE